MRSEEMLKINISKKIGLFLTLIAIYLIGWSVCLGLSVFALNQYTIIVKILGYILSLAASLFVGYIIARLLHKSEKYKTAFHIGHLILVVGFICIISIPVLSVHGSVIDTAKWLLDGGIADYNAPFLLVLFSFYIYHIFYHLITTISFTFILKRNKV